jgi:hypothetical protein
MRRGAVDGARSEFDLNVLSLDVDLDIRVDPDLDGDRVRVGDKRPDADFGL